MSYNTSNKLITRGSYAVALPTIEYYDKPTCTYVAMIISHQSFLQALFTLLIAQAGSNFNLKTLLRSPNS